MDVPRATLLISARGNGRCDSWGAECGLYGQVWIIAQSFVRGCPRNRIPRLVSPVQDWVEKLMRLNRNKLPFYQRALRAMKLIQQGL
jgi:hypothetical protein